MATPGGVSQALGIARSKVSLKDDPYETAGACAPIVQRIAVVLVATSGA